MTSLDDLRKLAGRVRAATEALDALRQQRDTAIREVRRAGGHTVPEIGVSEATVKTVIRGLR